ncbi:MAG: methyl-accepting chemotaxis protein [Alphaproteobacteria bacterium]|nr:methyl-accepting chemotaxis protein [Alphaproteobacteria bacterium]
MFGFKASHGAGGAQAQAIALVEEDPAAETAIDAPRFDFRAMVDEMPINVMTCRLEDFRVDYANKATLRTLESIEHALPIRARDLVGETIDVFHKRPQHQHSMLRDPSNLPHRAQIEIGGEHLSLLVSAIRDEQGRYVGPMLTWSVVTDRVKLAERVTEVVDAVCASGAHIDEETGALQDAAGRTLDLAAAVAASSEQAAGAVQAVAGASEQLTASIGEIAEQVGQASAVVGAASERAGTVGTAVESLAKAAGEIGEVVRLISEIASQTNLLALNATIEAARAGEAGKGFAVVAGEVKALAGETAAATDRITGQIKQIQAVVNDVVAGVRDVGGAIDEITETTATISSAVEEQNAATREISENVAQASSGVQGVARSVDEMRQAADGNRAVATSIAARVSELLPQAEELRAQVESFIHDQR